MRYYPIFLNLHNKLCVVIGGGKVAERKVISLLRAGALVKLISPKITEGLKKLKLAGDIQHISRNYKYGDLENTFLAIAATSDIQVNKQVSQEAYIKNIPVNVINSIESCSFILPSIISKGAFTVAISTSGISPAIARTLKDYIEASLPENIEDFLIYIDNIRKDVIRNIKNPIERKKILKAIGSNCSIEILKKEGINKVKEYIEKIIKE